MTAQRSRRYGVELYFILYLSALLLLLPPAHDRPTLNLEPLFYTLIGNSLDLIAARNTMLIRLTQQQQRWTIKSGDSLNIISILGNVEITDIACVAYHLGSTERFIYNATAMGTLPFSLYFDSLLHRIIFIWHPSRQASLQPTTFQVRLTVTAKPLFSLPTDSQDSLLIQFQQWLATTPIALRDSVEFSIQFLPDPIPIPPEGTTGAIVQQDIESPTLTQPAAPITIIQQTSTRSFSARPAESRIHTLQGERWSNPVFLEGLSTTSSLPIVDLSCIPSQYQETLHYQFLDHSTLLISGLAPSTDTLSVVVLLTHPDIAQAVKFQFTVIPHPLPPPRIPQIMYPEITYQFIPNFPFLSARDIRAILRTDSEIRYTSIRGEPFEFTPQQRDTNRIFIFERYIENRRIGESFTIPVKPFPPPEIIEILPADNRFLVRVQSYGMVNNIPNRSRLTVLSDNATISERYGDYIYMAETHLHLQTFVVTPNESGTSIQIQAIDRRGKRSKVHTIHAP